MEFRRSRAVQGRQGRWTVRSAQHEWRTHRRSTASGAVPIKLKVAKGTAVHAAVAFVRLPLLLQHHAPPFCAGVLEPDLRTHRNHTVECVYVRIAYLRVSDASAASADRRESARRDSCTGYPMNVTILLRFRVHFSSVVDIFVRGYFRASLESRWNDIIDYGELATRIF